MSKTTVKVFIQLLLVLKISSAEEAVIKLPDGSIRGRTSETWTGLKYFQFEGIPFAAPPIGELRFKAPLPPKPWPGVLNTTNSDVMCYQVSFNWAEESEDCLYLNVYTPQLPNQNSTSLLPVMFYIFGGGFVLGDARQLRPANLVQENVILVSVNYRLGPFGFLSTQDDEIPGNAGLKDQQLALKWTHQNIHLFGGDPKQITIFGLSAGAASVSYQLLNKQNQGLIKGAILMSGTALNPWTYKTDAREIAFKTTAILNPLFNVSRNSRALHRFLLGVKARDLDRASAEYGRSAFNQYFSGFDYSPVIETKHPGAFISEKMYHLVKSGDFVNVPVLVGLTAEEMLFSYQDNSTLGRVLELYDSQPEKVVPPGMLIRNNQLRKTVAQNIKNLYTHGKNWTENYGIGLGYSSDDSFARSIIKFVELVSRISKTYFYTFSYLGELNAKKYYYEGAEKAGHGDENKFINHPAQNVSSNDELTIQRLVKAFTNFAKFQNPTPEKVPLFHNITWPLVNTTNGDILYLNINQTLEVRNRPRNATYSAWVQLYDSLGYDNFDTY